MKLPRTKYGKLKYPRARPLWRFPLHKLGVAVSEAHKGMFAWGVLLHAGGERGIMLAWIRREEKERDMRNLR